MSQTPTWSTFEGIVCGQHRMSRSAFGERVGKAVAALQSLGVKPDSCVGVCLRNDIAMLEACLGINQCGARPTPINWHLSGEEIAWIANDAQCEQLIIHADLWWEIREHLPDHLTAVLVTPSQDLVQAYAIATEKTVAPEGMLEWHDLVEKHQPATGSPEKRSFPVIYTSGTTGRPKAVRWPTMTEEQYKAASQTRGNLYGANENNRCLIPGPVYHGAPYAAALQGAQRSPLTVVLPKFDPEVFLETVETYAITSCVMTPILYHRLLALPDDVKDRYDVSSLQYIIHTAAPCSADVKRRMIDWFGPIINEMYASTETGAVAFCKSEDALMKPGTAGKPIKGKVVRILDDNLQEVPAGTTGVIYASKPAVDFIYQSHPEARKKMEVDGLITVGDMGYLDEDGYLFVVDRATDMVISGGVNIYPREIENAILRHDQVYDCAVFGVPDEEYGESLMAHVQPKPGAMVAAEDVKGFLKDQIGRFKIPKAIKIVDDLPREDTGKIFKRKIRDQYWADAERKI